MSLLYRSRLRPEELFQLAVASAQRTPMSAVLFWTNLCDRQGSLHPVASADEGRSGTDF